VLLQRPLDADGAGHGPPRRGEGDHEAVAHCLDLVALVVTHVSAHEVLVRPQYLSRRFVAPAGRQIRRAFNVREEDGDGTFW